MMIAVAFGLKFQKQKEIGLPKLNQSAAKRGEEDGDWVTPGSGSDEAIEPALSVPFLSHCNDNCLGLIKRVSGRGEGRHSYNPGNGL